MDGPIQIYSTSICSLHTHTYEQEISLLFVGAT